MALSLQLRSLLLALGVVLLLGDRYAANAQNEPAHESGETRLTTSGAVRIHYEKLPHPVVRSNDRWFTNRKSRVQLPLPEESDAFSFVVFGDRTGGPPEGIEILKQAVHDTNLLEPDLVMTVGDLIQGYNDRAAWLPQMREYKSEMNQLLCPWFPVAGNHDIYWRGPERPQLHHEDNYEKHFGPLWYAFRHKSSLFIALFSDEGNPETGEKSFQVPELQRMSPEQFAWLKQTLAQNEDAEHVFLFLHHPRWLGRNYGDDWERVHRLLADAGNVRAVFAGHIHQMRYDGPRDGIEYVTLATVGGGQSGFSEAGGFLHHFHVVTVRERQIALACLPLGAVMDVREITGEVNEGIRAIVGTPPTFPSRPVVGNDGTTTQPVVVELFNPTSQVVEYEVTLDPENRHWMCQPDHFHRKLYAGQRVTLPLQLRVLVPADEHRFEAPSLVVNADYLTSTARFPIRERRYPMPLAFAIDAPASPDVDLAAETGPGRFFAVDSSAIAVPDGPLTLECWFKANSFSQRVGLVTKTQSSEYGIFVSGGTPYFTIHLDGRYYEPQDVGVQLKVGQWHHLAGVFDGREVRTYVDGRLIAKGPASGTRTTNTLPLVIGGGVNNAGEAVSPFDGLIDAVRLSTTARYDGDPFDPGRRWTVDDKTSLLFNFDGLTGPLAFDESAQQAHARGFGEVRLAPCDP